MSVIPYPGLRPFTQEETDIFFGREKHIDQLLEKLCQHRFISVTGPSGCGKSSLVRAGLISALETGYFSKVGVYWRVAKIRSGKHPLRNLAEGLLSVLESERSKSTREQTQADTTVLPFLISSLDRGPQGLVEILREVRLPKRTRVLLLIDQFEEIFRYRRDKNSEELEAFVALLLASTKQEELPIYVVMTMCSDFIGECTVFPDLPEMINGGQFWVSHLTREQQQMAIIGPAGVFGATVDPHLVNYLRNKMETDSAQLPVLQHCLMRMWFQARARLDMPEEEIEPTLSGLPTAGGITITPDDYEAVGGLKDAFSRHAEETFEELNEKQKKIAESLFRGLSTHNSQSDVRRPVKVNEVAAVAGVSVSDVIEVVEKFRHSERCFMTPDAGVPLDADSLLNISYESLNRLWHRMSEWARQETESAKIYRRLEQTADLWKKEQAALWNAADLDIALAWKEREKPTAEWAKRYGNHFDVAMEFLDFSEQARQKELRPIRQLRPKSIVTIIEVIIIIGSVTWAFKEMSGTQEARKMAQANQTNYESVVSMTFGFLGESKQSENFLQWVENTSTMESLKPALYLMIDSSETMSDEDKEFWREKLPVLPRRFIVKLLKALARERAERALNQ